MLDDAANVVQGKFRQTGVAVTGEQVLAVFPDGLVNVHAGAVVTNDGLRHEGGGFAVGVGHVLHHVLEDLRPVGALNQRAETGTDFVLACASDFVVEHFNRNAKAFQNQRHFGAHVLRAVHRRHREVAAFDSGAMAAVAAFELGTRIPGGFVFFNLEEGARHVGVPAHVVEDEELWLRAEISGVAQAGGLEVGLGALRDRARVAVVGLAVAGLNDVAAHEEGGFFKERVDVGRVGIRHQLHVGSFNTLPASDR